MHPKKRRAGCTRLREGEEETATVTHRSIGKEEEGTHRRPGPAPGYASQSHRAGKEEAINRTSAAPVVGRTAVGDQGMALQDLAEAQPLDGVRANGNSSIKMRRPLKQATETILKFLNASVRTYM
jgi:hypothetical protein